MGGRQLDDSEIEVTCSNGHKIKKTIGALRRSPSFRCPRCGQNITVDGSELDREMRKIDRAFDDLQKSLKKFGR
jgi:hypothetical protein